MPRGRASKIKNKVKIWLAHGMLDSQGFHNYSYTSKNLTTCQQDKLKKKK
jgi:hypothetical protein